MFTVKYHLLRNRGRTLLLVLAAAVLVGCVGLYLGNVLFARRALESLGDSVPVHVQVLSTDGERSSGIMIHSRQYDGLINGGVRKVRATSLAAGVYDEALKAEAFTGGDTYILGVNCMEALPLKGYTFTYAPGESEACLGGTEAKCLVDAVYAGERGISPGEEMSLLLYLSVPGSDYVKVGEVSFTVAGTYAGKRKEESGISVVAPVGWLRAETEAAGQKFFCYDSVSAEVADPLRLNEFKAAMEEAGFFEPAPPEGGISSAVQVMGDALSVEDKLFIKAANQLEQNLLVYRVFFLPLYGAGGRCAGPSVVSYPARQQKGNGHCARSGAAEVENSPLLSLLDPDHRPAGLFAGAAGNGRRDRAFLCADDLRRVSALLCAGGRSRPWLHFPL